MLFSSNQKFWFSHHHKSTKFLFFVLKNSKIIIDVHEIQGMRCVMCHGNGDTQVLITLTTQGTKKVLLPTTQNMALTT